ncbi:LysE/ArgO family amino acid transporter [Cryobacterium psychrophilum]|uniref:Amino acid transporter n=1 Tax=Cryobacterium psychrophilum TaxID=41988 RepID=A0A4Y8KNG3_9MICO|nr:LysE/ArgO family amino acid transporter [Cryobacterium psychrophilum]TDW29050.1 L-lysine exporter family protein LysE/ArgO [Cryobacterium psychrophilum]TFD79737.1 amino acid transporter [Cryobacterium psychrophilum]
MTPATTLVPALLGLLTGLTLIVAIGTQNAFVLRLGIEGRNRVIAPVVAICALSDAALILAGVVGLGAVITAAPVAIVVIRVLGSAFLIGYGLWAARRAIRPGALVVTGARGETGLRVAVTTVLALTWLNPHVYLDTVLFLGGVANQQGSPERWWWAAGAVLGSFVWFAALGFGARLLRPLFARPSSWRVLDVVIAVVMLALGIRLALGH